MSPATSPYVPEWLLGSTGLRLPHPRQKRITHRREAGSGAEMRAPALRVSAGMSGSRDIGRSPGPGLGEQTFPSC